MPSTELPPALLAAAATDAFLREVGIVLQFTHRHEAASAGRGAVQPFPPALRRQVAAAAQRLVVCMASRGSPTLASLLLEGVLADGCTPAEAVAAMDGACPAGMTLLHVVAGVRCVEIVGVLRGWGRQHGYTWSLRPSQQQGGRGGPSPLHLAAALPNGGPMMAALSGDR